MSIFNFNNTLQPSLFANQQSSSTSNQSLFPALFASPQPNTSASNDFSKGSMFNSSPLSNQFPFGNNSMQNGNPSNNVFNPSYAPPQPSNAALKGNGLNFNFTFSTLPSQPTSFFNQPSTFLNKDNWFNQKGSSIFGSDSASNGFVNSYSQVGTNYNYQPLCNADGRFISISAAEGYSRKSVEELRVEDYNKKQQGLSSSINFFSNKSSNFFENSLNQPFGQQNDFNMNRNSGSTSGNVGGIFQSSLRSSNANVRNDLFNTGSNTNQLQGQSLFPQSHQNQSLFNTSSLFPTSTQPQLTTSFFTTPQQPQPQGLQLFPNNNSFLFSTPQQPSPQSQMSLFSTPQQPQPQVSLFASPQQPQPAFSLFSSNQPQPQPQLGISYLPYSPIPLYHPIFPSDPINQYIFNTTKTKTLTQILNELQAQYTDNSNDFGQPPKNEKDELAYDSFMNTRLSEFKEFLKFKRSYDSGKESKSKKPAPQSEKKNQIIFDPIKQDYFNQNPAALALKGKSHSCDISKAQEKTILSNLAQTFDQTLLFEDLPFVRKSSDVSAFLNLKIQIIEPSRVCFSMKISKNAKFKALKTTIADTLREKSSKYLNLEADSFILMKKYAIVKETSLIAESGLVEGDILFVILKESISKNESEVTMSSIRNSPGKRRKNELAPMDKLPVLTKAGYKILPDMKTIYRMSLSELEKVQGLEIYNEYGRISFNEPCDLTAINFDQIVSIGPGEVTLYSTDNGNYLPPERSGLNQPATIHLYHINDDKCKSESDERTLTYSYQEKRCREMNWEFKGYNSMTEEFIYFIEHF